MRHLVDILKLSIIMNFSYLSTRSEGTGCLSKADEMTLLCALFAGVFVANHDARFLGRFHRCAAITWSFLLRPLAGWSGSILGGRAGCLASVFLVDAELRVAFDVADVPDSERRVV